MQLNLTVLLLRLFEITYSIILVKMAQVDQNEDDIVVLEFENSSIPCSKKVLVDNSDYFKTMFGGSFLEHQQKVIKIHDISLKMMELILMVLFDKTVELDESETLLILEASCLLLFTDIKEAYERKVLNFLTPKSSIKIWILADKLDIKTVRLKAKALALTEFENIKNYDVFKDLHLNQLYNYLANTALCCNNEMEVFDIVVKWWHDNSEKLFEKNVDISLELFKYDTFLILLSCINFKCLSKENIEKILNNDNFKDNEIQKVLCCVIGMKEGNECTEDRDVVDKATVLFNSKRRKSRNCPCVLVNKVEEPQSRVIVKDSCKRKRYSVDIAADNSALVGIFYDGYKLSFSKYFVMDCKDSKYLNGFRILGNKQFIFLFGGELVIDGKGSWNTHFWMYDTIREVWNIKTQLKNLRRYFQACICGDCVYIIGGTGIFRVIKDDMLIYNFKKDTWSSAALPIARQFKSCVLNDELFIFDMNAPLVYMFEGEKWTKLPISPTPDFSKKNFVVFSYDDHFYIKGDNLVKLKKNGSSLNVIDSQPVSYLNCDQADAVVCDNILYTLYKRRCMEKGIFCIWLEKFNIDSKNSEYILQDVLEGSQVSIQNETFLYRLSPIMFSHHHYSLFENDEFVTNAIFN